MSLLSKDDLLELQEANSPCVSIYLPTHRAGREIEQNPIRLKNLLSTAEKELEEAVDSGDDSVRSILQPARELLDDRDFWQHQRDGLALLLSPGTHKILRLPLEFEELVVVGARFHLKPLLPLLTEGGRFYVLALSRGSVRLFLATPHRISEIDLQDAVPKSVADALGYDWEQRSLQYHAQRRGGSSRNEAIYHGHGAGTDDREAELRQFLTILDRGLDEVLTKTGRPMVLAGVDEVTAVFRQISKYPHLVEGTVAGNFDDTAPADLQREAWEVVEPQFLAGREKAAAHFVELQGVGRASSQLEDIVPAAHDGRIEIAFVPLGERIWGRYDPAQRTVERVDSRHDAGEHRSGEDQDLDSLQQPVDLLDLAALRSLATGATVYAVANEEMPGDGEAAAIFRY